MFLYKMYIVNVYLDTLTIKINLKGGKIWIKNVIVKGLTALTILTSLGFAENISDQPHSIAKAEKNVKEITDATKAPYNSVVAFAGGTGVVVGKNTIVTNKHIAKSNNILKIEYQHIIRVKVKVEETTTLKIL